MFQTEGGVSLLFYLISTTQSLNGERFGSGDEKVFAVLRLVTGEGMNTLSYFDATSNESNQACLTALVPP